ncbi:helix-turn-helix domain-containing protein [Maricaulis sp.]|uniref:helix-turn-helix domain-containing protein n=1 Tax=Maricaulis sp. TaxID=1486257 RepID=UPI0026338172|nr:helix-turn-helix domain-containing protein [Maricaulis sp.]
MNWGAELRAFRRRTGLKQETLADLLHVSQAYISRIEGGSAEPKANLENRIQALLSDPSYLDVIEFALKSVRVSPLMTCIIRPDDGEVRYVAISAGMRNHPRFSSIGEGQVVDTQISAQGQQLLAIIKESGIFSGHVEAVDAIWHSEYEGVKDYWHGVYTPMRGREADWYLHVAIDRICADRFSQLENGREGWVRITSIH